MEELRSGIVNNFDEVGPASLDLAAGDESPVLLARKIFEYYVGGVKVDRESADNICQVSLEAFVCLLMFRSGKEDNRDLWNY